MCHVYSPGVMLFTVADWFLTHRMGKAFPFIFERNCLGEWLTKRLIPKSKI